jgi:hypothetical protein
MTLSFCAKHQNHVFPANLKEIVALFTSNISMPFGVKHRNHVFPADSNEIEFAQRSAESSASLDHGITTLSNLCTSSLHPDKIVTPLNFVHSMVLIW